MINLCCVVMLHVFKLNHELYDAIQSGVDASRKRTRDGTMMGGEGTQLLTRTEVSDGSEL